MPKFQHNDVVKCINNKDVPSLVVGMNYPVQTCDENYVWLAMERYDGYKFNLPTAFSPSRFEHTDEVVTFEPTLDNDTIYFEEDEEVYEGSTDILEAVALLRKAASVLEDCHAYELAEEINKFLGDE